MKKSIFFGLLILIFAISAFNYSATGQDNVPAGKAIKSRIVHEEKTVKGVMTKSIDSEEKYDSRGNVIEEISYKGGKKDKHMVYEYDAQNNKIKETELDAWGKPKKIGVFKYVDGLKSEKLVYDADKNLVSKKTYTYKY